MILLEAVNKIITRLGENPVDHVDYKHPTVSIILKQLEAVSIELQLRGWWFNTRKVTLQPDSSGRIKLPPNTLTFLDDESKAYKLGEYLHNTETENDIFNKEVKGSCILQLDIEVLPQSFAEYVVAETATRVYVADFGLEDTYGVYKQEAVMWNQKVWREHLQNIKLSTRNNRTARRVLLAKWR